MKFLGRAWLGSGLRSALRRRRLSVCRARNNDLRQTHGPRVHRSPSGRLLQSYPQVTPRVLELFEVVLAHETEELIDLLDFWTRDGGTLCWFRGLFSFHAGVK